MSVFIEETFKQKRYSSVVSECEKIDKNKMSDSELEMYALSLTQLGMHKEALKQYSVIAKRSQPFLDISYAVIKGFRLSYRKVSTNVPFNEASFWSECGKGFEESFDNALSLAREYKPGDGCEKLLENVNIGLVRLGFNAEEIDLVKLSIKNIFRGAEGKVALQAEGDFYYPPQFSKIFVSGLGWSGSGAVLAYLREFDDVHAVQGETPFVSLAYFSLRSVYKSIDDHGKLFFMLLCFFLKTLLGFQSINKWGDLRFSNLSRSSWKSGGAKRKSSQALFSLSTLANKVLLSQGEERSLQFSEFSEFVINSFASKFYEGGKPFVILDNVVPIAKLDSISFIKDSFVICVVRDPRSNYATIMKESPGGITSVESYIERRGSMLRQLSHELEVARIAGDSQGSKVFTVQFETFVLSESFRVEMAKEIGIDVSKTKKFSRFKPWESMRNVVIHQEYPNQDDINLIEAELMDYCVEPFVRPFLEEASSKGE